MDFIRPYLIVLLFALSANLYSQTPSFNFQKLGSEDGLNNANIFNIEQHQNGLMYFTTQNGIYYYDGYSFNKLDIDSLKSNALINVSIKNNDELYLSLREDGLANFNLKTKEFTFDPKLRIKENNADNIVLTDDYAYLLTSEIKIVIVDLKNGKIIPDDLKKKDIMNRPFCIYKTKNGGVLIGRSDGIYDATNGKQIRLEVLKNNTIHSITQTKEGKLVVGTSSKIFIIQNNKIESEIKPVYETKNNTFQLSGERPIGNIIADEYGRIWFTSYPHENLYLLENNRVYDVFEALDIQPALINCIYKDENQNIWIGTYNDGVYYIHNPFFNSLSFSFNNKNLNIHQVFLSNNLLVAATSNGLYGLNLSDGKTKILSKPDEIFLEPVSSITEFDGIFYYAKRNQMNMIQSMIFDSKNNYIFKPVIARQYYPINKDESVVADWDNANILLCNLDATKTLDTLISFPDYRISINAFLKKDNLLYIGTSNGLYVYDFKSKRNKNLVRNELNFNINDVAIINNKLYAAHEAGITDVYDGKLIQQVGKFRLNTVKKIKQYNDQIWLATLDGIYVCDKNLVPLKTLNKSNGLLSNSINDITFNDQTVSIATARGVSTAEFKDIIRFNSTLKPVTLNTISSNGSVYGAGKSEYKFTASQENISINFFSPLFNKPNKQFFKWRIDGSDWKYFNNPTFDVTLTGGSHLIEISASADNISWSENTLVHIEKEQKLTEKQSIYWLITLGSLSLILLISFVWIRRVKIKARKRLKDEQQVNLLKHQAMNSLLSPHFIFNSLTSIQNYINTNKGLQASEYLAKFSRLIRMIIEKAAQSDISLHDELSRLTYYLELEKERFKNKFDYVINIDDNIKTHEIQIPNMIIQPFVENCIIHGILPKQEHGELIISFKTKGNRKFLITIEDNGIGLIKASEHAKTGHKSLGTSTINNILEINSKLSGKKQKVTMIDKSTLDENTNGTLITIELEL
ncbi:sensor histidine kinase [Aurantibacillus circumpalustris]|uniref:sensor histidine kinase n=1 Tax=Aurantibacillus circumpalustris TaxID=3036359 RepID=UPI00295A64A1|nr:histidine kinase [Aurantibacillus circumpalustris]